MKQSRLAQNRVPDPRAGTRRARRRAGTVAAMPRVMPVLVSVLVVTVLVVTILGAVLVVSVLVSVAAQPTDSTPLSPAQREAIRQDFAATQRSAVRLSSGARLPEARFGPTVSDFDWTVAVGGCLDRRGFNVEVSTDRRSFQGDAGDGVDPFDAFQIAQFECFLAHPSIGNLVRRLDRPQLAALHGYWAGIVRPCLSLNGQRTPAAPPRDVFVQTPVWNPFAVPIDQLSPADVVRLEGACPPVPPWLSIADPAA